MMKYEFEELAGYEVSWEDYTNIIEPMYMAVSLPKQEFVKVLDRKRFALPTKKKMVSKMRRLAEHLKETCGHYTDYEAKGELEKLATEYAKRFHGLEWSKDIEAYRYFLKEYEYPEIQRGCTYPRELVIGRGNTEYERITLVK